MIENNEKAHADSYDPGHCSYGHKVDSSQGGDDQPSLGFIAIRRDERVRRWMRVISLTVAFVFFIQQTGFADVYSYKRQAGVAETLLPTADEYDKINRFSPSHLKRAQRPVAGSCWCRIAVEQFDLLHRLPGINPLRCVPMSPVPVHRLAQRLADRRLGQAEFPHRLAWIKVLVPP